LVALKIKNYLSQSMFAKGVLAIASGTLVGQFIVFLSTPAIARLYSPNDYGVLAVYSSILNVIVAISCLRYELAIPLPEDDQTAAHVLVLALIICFIVSILSGLALWGLGDFIVTVTKTPAMKAYLWLLPLGAFGAASYTVFSLWAVREHNYVKLGQTKLAQGIMLVTTQIFLGIINIKPLGLLLGLLAGHTAGMATLAVSALQKIKQVLKNVSIYHILKVARRYRRFPLFSSYTSLIDTIGSQAPAFLLAVLYGPSITGLYALSQTAVFAPVILLGRSVDQVYFSEASRLLRKDPREESLLKLYLNTAKKMFLLGILFVIPLLLFSPVLFELLFGEQWRESGCYVQVMTPMMLSNFVANPISQTLNVIERQDIQLLWAIIWLMSISISFAVTYYFNLSALYAVALLSLMMTTCYLIHIFLCVFMLKKLGLKQSV